MIQNEIMALGWRQPNAAVVHERDDIIIICESIFFDSKEKNLWFNVWCACVCVLFLKRTIIILSKKIRRKNDDDGFQKKIWSIHFSPSHSIHDSLLLFFNLKFNLLEKEREREQNLFMEWNQWNVTILSLMVVQYFLSAL